MQVRIAVVQHGDLDEARRLRAAGEPEPYFGMHYSQGFLDSWLAGRPHRVISLNAPAYRSTESVSVPEPKAWPGEPGTLRQLRWSRRIIRELVDFQPTHLLLRCGSLLASRILRAAHRRKWNVLAMFAGFFPNTRRYDRVVTRRIVTHLNRPNVHAAGNHRQPATDSMIEAGLDPAKAIAWDYPLERDPSAFPFKYLPTGPIEIVYAGSMTVAKGVFEPIDAVGLLRSRGKDVRLTLCGSGPDLPAIQARAAGLGDAGSFLGRVGNDQVFARMAAATFVCVPTRHEFPEGFPLTMTEALTAHTPVLASDHPVFTRVLPDGEGLRYFPAGQGSALATLIDQLTGDGAAYADLSRRTTAAFDRLQCPVRFHEVIERWLLSRAE